MVNNNDIYFNKFAYKVHHSRLTDLTISQSMMDQILNLHYYQNWIIISILMKKVFQVQEVKCWFNLKQLMKGSGQLDSQQKYIILQSIQSVRIG